jgi:hypothetical protein
MRPNVVKVSGTCQENVLISGFDNLTIIGKPGATLLPAPPATAYAVEVTASRAVTIEALTIQQPENRTAVSLTECAYCRLKSVTVDGGVGISTVGGQLFLSQFSMTGPGGYAAVAAWGAARVDVEDSVFDGGPPGPYGWGRFSGLWIGENATGRVVRSQFHHLGTAAVAGGGGRLLVDEETTIEENGCIGVWVFGGALLDIRASHVRNNAANCFDSGIRVDGAATLFVERTDVTDNTGGGIRLNHQAFAQIGGGTTITSNIGPGLEVRNLSMAVAPGPQNPPQTVEISANQGDLVCDSISHINNGAQITGAAPPGGQCTNFHSGDGP